MLVAWFLVIFLLTKLLKFSNLQSTTDLKIIYKKQNINAALQNTNVSLNCLDRQYCFFLSL